MSETNTTAASGKPAYFRANDIHAYYGESYIVQGVSLEVEEGEILALLGRNGAGKTSTLRALARVDDPMLTQGEVWPVISSCYCSMNPMKVWPL